MNLQTIGISFLCACSALAAAPEPEVRTTVPVVENAEAQKPLFAPAVAEISASVAVPTPLFADVKNLQDKTFDADAKLRLPVPAPEKLAFVKAAPRAADGFFVAELETPVAQDAITVFRTFATVHAFTRAKIRAVTPQKCELWVNGKKLADKLSVETELEKSGAANADFNMEVDRYEIVVKTLTQKDSALPPSVKIEIEPLREDVPAVTFSDGTEKRPVTIADVNEVNRISSLRVSPDGRFVHLSYNRLRDDGSFEFRQEVRETATGKPVFVEDGSRHYAWMPKGSVLYYRRKDLNDRCAYVGFDLEKREEVVLAEGLPDSNHSYTWLPDQSGFIVSKTEKWTNESADWKRVLNPQDRGAGWRDRSFLLRYDLKTGVFTPLTAGAKTTWLMSVSPDSKKILFSTGTFDPAQPEYVRNDVYLMNLDTRECEKIFADEKYGISFGDWSPDSRKFVLLSGPDAFGGIGSTLPEGTAANSFDQQAFIYDTETKELDPVSRDFDPSISSAIWAGDGAVYFRTVDADRESVFRYDPAARSYARVNVPEDIVTNFNVSRDPAAFTPIAYAVGSGATTFPRAYAVDLAKNAGVPVFNEEPAPEDEIAMPTVVPWKFTASDGAEIDGHCFLPADFDPTKKYPLIVYYYSGTTPTSRVLGSHYPFPLYTAQGYVVYVLQPSGTIGFGQEFSARHLNAWGRRTADDIIEGVKRFCAEHPFVDEKKIGCIGASYGGFMTMYLQTRTDIFAAAVAHAGISDITSYWGEGMWGYAYNATAAAGSFPWKNREIFVDQSPLFSADKVNTPILLCHGLSDINVPVGESIQMFTALKLLNKPVELLTFTAEDHGIMNYNRRKQWIKSHLAWFARWLQDDPDWWNTLYPDKNW